MEGLVSHTPMTDILRERGVFDAHPFVLVDVGCAGGIAEPWRAFGDSLIAHGYDTDIGACEESQARERFPNVHYHARFVGLPESHPFVQRRRAEAADWPNTNIWGRVTAGHLAGKQQEDPDASAAGPRLADASTVIGVDEIVRGERLPTVDFLKVDVDGPDLEVLESAREVLADCKVLGVCVEVNWFGSGNPTEHTFHNTDRFLRLHSYALFGLTVRHYSRTDLPAPFVRELYAETRFGQPYQGDAIYVRDLAAPDHDDLADSYPAEKLIKLACVYELIGLPDCAAEVLNRSQPRLAAFGDLEPLLDALTPPLLGKRLSYREYISAFEQEPHRFLPSAEGGASEVVLEPRAPEPEAVPLQSPAREAHHPVFDGFRPWAGEVAAGWSVNFLGVRTRDEFNAGMAGASPAGRRHVQTPLPSFDEEYFEWIDLLEAVTGGEGSFTMIELGAGWGRWLVNGAAAARANNRLPLYLVGVEAEPTHFRWMRQHFKDNDIDKRSLKLIDAAVAAHGGRVPFHVGDPSAWYGQAIEHNQPSTEREPSLFQRLRGPLESRARRDERAIVDVRAVTLGSILEGLERVDLIDLDVQGVEADVLEAADDALSEKVKRAHIGTHSADNERRLRALFARLGWENLNDYRCGSEADTPWGRISFQDGVQTWLNPRLGAGVTRPGRAPTQWTGD
jgi:FkbM family methyltransferase